MGMRDESAISEKWKITWTDGRKEGEIEGKRWYIVYDVTCLRRIYSWELTKTYKCLVSIAAKQL